MLPLANLSADPSQQYLVDGMTEELTSEISQLHSLRVISRTSTMQYRDTHKKAPQIAKELHADGLIEGSILRVNDRVRITAQLIHGPSDTHVWSKSYERDLRNVIALQHEIASDIAREVRISLGPQEQAHLARAREVIPEAHEAYLRGRFHLQNGSRSFNPPRPGLFPAGDPERRRICSGLRRGGRCLHRDAQRLRCSQRGHAQGQSGSSKSGCIGRNPARSACIARWRAHVL